MARMALALSQELVKLGKFGRVFGPGLFDVGIVHGGGFFRKFANIKEICKLAVMC